MTDHSMMKLGRLPYVFDPNTPKMKSLLTRAVFPRLPDSYKNSILVPSWPMLGNDVISDCTLAGILHQRQVWRAASGVTYLPTTEEAIALYKQLGYNPADPSTDTGEVELDVLKFCATTGFADGTKLGQFVEAQLGDVNHIKYAIWQLGGAYLGVALPLSAQTQDVWDVVKGPKRMTAPSSWGNHCVIAVDYEAGGIWVVTWGKLVFVTWKFWARYIDETWGIASSDFINAKGTTPLGLDMAGLDAATQLIAA
jgi:hypothetical protein